MEKLLEVGEFFEALEAESVVDLGCGDGAFLQAALGKLRGWKSAFGIDPSFRAVEKASERFKDDIRVCFIQAGAEKLPLKDACADLALMSMSVHHMERPRLAMAEAFRILSPGGALAVHEPVDEDLDASQRLREEYHAIRGEIEKALGGFMRPILRVD
jgi:ArsR family transcriptional regulator